MVNSCTFVGRAAKDGELRYTQGGTAVASLTLAVGDKFKNKQGEMQETTEWVNCVFWGRLAEVVAEFCLKGTLMYVSGKMQTRKFQDRDGNDRYMTEINCQEMKLLGGNGGSKGGKGEGGKPKGGYDGPAFDADMDIPF